MPKFQYFMVSLSNDEAKPIPCVISHQDQNAFLKYVNNSNRNRKVPDIYIYPDLTFVDHDQEIKMQKFKYFMVNVESNDQKREASFKYYGNRSEFLKYVNESNARNAEDTGLWIYPDLTYSEEPER